CPSCAVHRHGKTARSMGTGVLAAAVGACGAVLAGRAMGSGTVEAAGWVVLNFSLWQVLITALVIPHELAHAMVARVLGMRVYRIRVGSGRLLWRSRVGGVDLQFRSLAWSGGLTMFAPGGRRAVRTRRAVVAIAGPLVHAVLLLPVAELGLGDL